MREHPGACYCDACELARQRRESGPPVITLDPIPMFCSTDELTTQFFTCPRCCYPRIPFGAGIEREPAHDARFCPGCGAAIEWIER